MTGATAAGVAGCILAGGLARRMGGGNKGLIKLGEKSILGHVIDRLQLQCGPIVLNSNSDSILFNDYDLPVIADPIKGHAGPLAGVLAGLKWMRLNAPDRDWLVTVAWDTPFFPANFVERLLDAVAENGASLACAASAGRHHPVFGLWPAALYEELWQAVVDEEIRKVDRWTARHKLAVAEFSCDPVDPFFNANRPDDVCEAERLYRKYIQ